MSMERPWHGAMWSRADANAVFCSQEDERYTVALALTCRSMGQITPGYPRPPNGDELSQ